MLWKTKVQTAVFLIVAVVAVNHANAEVPNDVTSQMCKLLIAILILLFIFVHYIGVIKNLTIEPARYITTLIESSISFICKATFTVSDGENCTTCITWKHNNSENISNSVIVKNNLIINGILYSHSGNYCCSISEANGSGGSTDGSSGSTESTELSACSSVTAIGKHISLYCTICTTVTIMQIVFTNHLYMYCRHGNQWNIYAASSWQYIYNQLHC